MDSILITGASGFLGSSLALSLASQRNAVVYALTSNPWKLEDYADMEYFKLVDINKEELVTRAFKQSDCVINCAFPRNADATGLATGLNYVCNVFSMAADFRVGSIINVSSQSVYSRHRTFPATENDTVCPESSYAVAKYASELMLNKICSNLIHTNIRLASLIGPQFEQRVVNKLVKQAESGKSLTIRDDGSLYGFLDIEDAVSGLEMLLSRKGNSWKQVYNLGLDEGLTLTQIAYTVRQLCPYPNSSVYDVVEVVDNAAQSNSTLDSSLFRSEFSWQPNIGLAKSIEKIRTYYRKMA